MTERVRRLRSGIAQSLHLDARQRCVHSVDDATERRAGNRVRDPGRWRHAVQLSNTLARPFVRTERDVLAHDACGIRHHELQQKLPMNTQRRAKAEVGVRRNTAHAEAPERVRPSRAASITITPVSSRASYGYAIN